LGKVRTIEAQAKWFSYKKENGIYLNQELALDGHMLFKVSNLVSFFPYCDILFLWELALTYHHCNITRKQEI